ncbi:hypothetical protein ECG_04865 [Echinococcus granulosus]|uniref:Uncharacterized protein n=1 Tax=Echinococcus granulosus TaxID=6210 RepID=A0A068WEJ0_ECHGR|nr:hypothetical protein ECG_04865 [Echinococcus granulosus]CDS16814.1 hypothetical protein EgrG_000951600 [Echinococcus granulosus]
MLFIVCAGFSLGYLFQELMSIYFLVNLIFYFHEDDPFASLYLRNIPTTYPHPLQSIHLAAVGGAINICLHISCVLILLGRKPLRQNDLSRTAIMRMFVASTYQFWCSLTACFTCLTGVVIWRRVFSSTLRTILSCTYKGSCTSKQNIVTPWEAIVRLNLEWERCLGIQTFHNTSITRKFDTIMAAFASSGHAISQCIESQYQLNVVSALSNYILNCCLCIIVNIMQMVYLGVMYTSKRAKVRPNNISTIQGSSDNETSGGDVLGTANTRARRTEDESEQSQQSSRQLTLTPRSIKRLSTKRTSSWSESSFFQQMHKSRHSNPTSDQKSHKDVTERSRI